MTIVTDGQQAIELCAQSDPPFELVVVSLDMEGVDALRVCSQLKSLEQTRQTPILIIVDPDDHQRLLRALDMGVNDYLIRPVDHQELQARVNTQIRRFRYTEQLRNSVQASMEMAVTDSLTGLYNRRYLETHLAQLVESCHQPRQALVGHHARRRLLQVGQRHPWPSMPAIACCRKWPGASARAIRRVDLACRTGGEEFVVVLPGTEIGIAQRVAERLRQAVANRPFTAAPGFALNITISARRRGAERRRRQCRYDFSSRPTRRSIAPSARAATA